MRLPGPNPIRKRGGKTFRQAIQRRLIKEDLKAKTDKALNEIAVELLDVAVQLSSGTVDSAKENHPYSQAGPNPAFDPRLINVGFERHSGKRFVDSWELLPKSQGIGIRNTSPIAVYLERGTFRMVKRPIDELILMRVDAIAPKHFDLAFGPDGTASLRLAA